MEKQSSTLPMPSGPLLAYSRKSLLSAAYLDRQQEFACLVKALAPKFEQLLACPPLPYGKLPSTIPKSGVYLFTENGQPLYVGRSNGLRQRHGRHCRPGATYRQAAFAFQLAREKTGRTKAAYKPGEESRKGLMLDPVFAAAILEAKARIRAMEYRYVEEADQVSAGFARDLLRRHTRHAVQRLRDALKPADQSSIARVRGKGEPPGTPRTGRTRQS
jgi:predicted GIY-YIG superfamily endonuclease